MTVFKSPLFADAGNNDLELCAASHAFNFYKGKPSNPGRFEAVNRIREALRLLGFPSSSDGPGAYGDGTARAVLAYKGAPRYILGPGQSAPDAVVGRKTIMRLDKDLVAAGLGGELPSSPVNPAPALGHEWWAFHLTTFTKFNTYLLTIQSFDQLEFAHFKFERQNIISLIAEISGSTRDSGFVNPALRMNDKVQLDDFDGALCDIRLRRDQQRNGGMLSGSISLTTSNGVSGRGEVPSYGQGTGDGLWKLAGKLVGPLDLRGLSLSSSTANAGNLSRVNHSARLA